MADEEKFREVNIDRAIYIVDDRAKTYRFLRRNPDFAELDAVENRRNKASIDGYARRFRNGRSKIFRYQP